MDSSRWVDDQGTLHEQYTALFFLGNSLLGSSKFDAGAQPALRYRRGGLAYFCAECGELWARVIFVDSTQQVNPFCCEDFPCLRHGGGSFLSEWLDGLIFLMPEAVLRYEFQQELKKHGY